MAHGGRARGELGGAPESSVGATKGALVPLFLGLKNLTTGAGAKAWGGWPREEMGAPESS